jgi:hypothetical protein
MIAEPHPLRCETCDHRVPYPRNATAGAYKFLYCEKTKKFLTDDILKDRAIELFSIVGCASHSASSDVLDELEKRAIEMKKDSDKCYEKYHGDEALSMSVCYGQMLEWIAELRQKKEEPEIQKEVGVAFFYQESIPYPKGEYKFRMKIIDETGERTTPERRNYAEAFTDLFNIGIK